MRLRFLSGFGGLFAVLTAGCGSDSPESTGSAGTAGENAGGSGGEATTKLPVRASCGEVPILDDRWKDTTDECKACVDTRCCDEAQACADNPDCKALWECRAKCELPVGDCVDACNTMTIPMENNVLIACRNACAACIDITTCAESEPPAPSEPSYLVTVHVKSYTTGGVVFPGVTLKVCGRADIECTNPFSQGVTDAEGNVDVEIPSSPQYTDAYLEITGPDVEPTRTYYRYAEYAEVRLESGLLVLPLLDSTTATALRGAMHATADPETVGLVTTFIFSCGHRGVSGMTAESSAADADTILQYLMGPAPSSEATTTSGSGVAIFADHPAGPTTITARNAETGEILGTTALDVRAGFLNSVFVLPASR